MKTRNILLLFSVVLLAACRESVTETVTYKINEPVFMSNETFRSSVKVSPKPQDIKVQGKIAFYQGYIYISEPEKGIHIIDNRNPSSPQNVGFIELLGNADLSIRNNLLYADSYVDLVWFDVSNPAQPQLKGRLENVFYDALPTTGNVYGYDYNKCYEGKKTGVIVGWTLTEKTEEVTRYTGGIWYEKGDLLTGNMASGGTSSSINGSMSRFALYKDYLYAVINNSMSIFNIASETPQKIDQTVYIGRNVETIFSYEDNMFMGTPTGMLIYSVASPEKPVYISSISHALGCDPVVVDNDLAYVTVHSGNLCGQNSNELMVIDVSNVQQPKQLVSYTMTKPLGLGVDNGKLFVCDDGLKVFKAGSPMTLMANQLAHFKAISGYDLIAYNNLLMMIAEDGLYQYDYSDINNIHLLSKLSFSK